MARDQRRAKSAHFDWVMKLMLTMIAIPFLLWGGCAYTRRRLAKRVEAKLAELRAEGLPVTLEELDAFYPSPQAGRNAATLYQRVFALLQAAPVPVAMPTLTTTPNGGSTDRLKGGASTPMDPMAQLPHVGSADTPLLAEPLPEAMKEAIRGYLKPREKALDLLHEAATIKECRFPVDLTQGFNALLTHLSEIRTCARVLSLDALLKAEEGDTEGVLHAMRTTVGVADSISKEPLVISSLVRMAILSMGQQQAQQALSRAPFTDVQLRELTSIFPQGDEGQAYRRSMAGELCSGISAYTNPELALAAMGGGGARGAGVHVAFGLYRVSSFLEKDVLSYVEIMTEQLRAADILIEQWVKHARKVDQKTRELPKTRLLSRMMLPALSSILKKHVWRVAQTRLLQVGVALERHRLAHDTYPAGLTDLVPEFLDAVPVDPFDAAPLRYRTTEQGFVVYSIGENGTDDGGVKPDPASGNRREKDITFRVER